MSDDPTPMPPETQPDAQPDAPHETPPTAGAQTPAAFWDTDPGMAATPAPAAPPPAELPDGFFGSAEWLPRRFDAVKGALELVRIGDPAVLGTSPLNEHIEGETTVVHVFGLIQAAIDAGYQGAPIGVIGSTAGCPALGAPLAPGLDAGTPGLVGALGVAAPVEPRLNPRTLEAMVAVRRSMFGRQVQQAQAQQWLAVTQALVALLARTNDPAARAVIVPGTGNTVISTDVLVVLPESRALLVHEPLEDAVARMMSSRARRNAALGAAAKMVPDLRMSGVLGNANLGMMPEHRRAALGWVAEKWSVIATAQRLGERTRTVEWSRVLEEPAGALGAAAAFFGVPFDNAKSAEAVAAVRALDDRAAIEAFRADNREIIDDAAGFVRDLHKRRPMPGVIPSPLLG